MAESKSQTGMVLLALGGLYLLTRPKPRHEAVPISTSSGPAPSGGSKSGSSGGGGGLGDALKAGAGLAKPIGAVATAIGAAAGVGAVEVIGAAVFIGAGAALGYAQAGWVGAGAGALNPIIGNVAIAGAKAGGAAVKAVGGNEAAQTTGAVGGGAMAGIATLADIAVAAALLPTVAIAVLFAELLGAIFGSDPPSPPTPQEKVDALYRIVLKSFTGLYSFMNATITKQDQVNAAAQLVALSNGPANFRPPLFPGEPPAAWTPGYTAIPNELRGPARGRAAQLGLAPLFDDATTATNQLPVSPFHKTAPVHGGNTAAWK